MPVQYTPQFIPTNAQALQGVLSEYQQAYDQNLARELEIQDQYSMIPTISPEDTQRKNQILGSFGETMGEIEKKYNYDRASSAYSKELARKIGELRKNDFWSYNERKKELAKAEAEDKRRIGAGYYSVYSPSKATYEDQTALDNYRPFDKRELTAMGRAIGEEYSKSNPKRSQSNIIDPRAGQVIGLQYADQLGFVTDKEMEGFLSSDKGKAMADQALLAAGIPEELLGDPELRAAALGGMRSGLVGNITYDRISLPTLPEKGPNKNRTPFIKVSTEAGDRVETPIPIDNAKDYIKLKRDPGRASTPEGQQSLDYMNRIVSRVESENTGTINNGIETLRTTLNEKLGSDSYTESELQNLFQELKDAYMANLGIEGPVRGDVMRTAMGKYAPDGRIEIMSNFLDKKGYNVQLPLGQVRNKFSTAEDVLSGMDQWYRNEYKPISREINDQIKEGYRPIWDVTIPGMIPESDKNLMTNFLINTVAVGAGSPVTAKYQSGKGKQGESDLYDDKALSKFNAIEGKVYPGILRSEGELPKIRLSKGEEVLDFTFKPEISSYNVWSGMAEQAEDRTMFMDAFYSGYDMLENTQYKLDRTSRAYVKDMSKLFKEKGVADGTIDSKLDGVTWSKEIDPASGESYYSINYKNQPLPDQSGNPVVVGSKEELFAVLTSLVID